MPDRSIELAKQKLVGGCQYDKISVRCEMTGGTVQFRSIVRDVLEHVDIEDRVEPRRFLDALDCADQYSAGFR
jgi:hypothetical protein